MRNPVDVRAEPLRVYRVGVGEGRNHRVRSGVLLASHRSEPELPDGYTVAGDDEGLAGVERPTSPLSLRSCAPTTA